MLVALGMTLVIATGGIDLSVGAVVGDLRCAGLLRISEQADQNSARRRAVAMAVGDRAVAGARAAGTGFLVAGIGIQPIIATLVLMVAGRGVAQLITERADHHHQQLARTS